MFFLTKCLAGWLTEWVAGYLSIRKPYEMQEYEMRVNQDKITFKDKANEKLYTSFFEIREIEIERESDILALE